MRKLFILSMGIVTIFAADACCMDVDIMMSALAGAKAGITEIFTSIDKDLAMAARGLSILDFKADAARKIISGLCQNKNYVIDCSIIDLTGKMSVVEPESHRKYEGSDIRNQEHIKSILKNKKPVFSDVFLSVEGIEAIDFQYPIFSDKNEFLGSVNMLVKQDALADDIIVPLVQGTPCKIWIMQKDGLVVYDPDPNQVGRNIFSDDFFKPFPVLISFSRTVAMAKNGAGSYNFYALGLDDKKIVKKYSVWDTVSLYGTEWRIIVMEADKPEPEPKDALDSKKNSLQ